MENGTIIIPPFAYSVLGLKHAELLIYGVIYGFTIGGKGRFFGSLKTLSEMTGLNRCYIREVLQKLTDKGYLKKYTISAMRVEYECTPKDDIVTPEKQEKPTRKTKQKAADKPSKIIIDCETVENVSNPITDDKNTVKTQENANKPPDDFSLSGEKPNPPKIRQPEGEVLTPVQMVWQAYKQAYIQRYGIEPLRNAKIFGQIKNFIAMVGEKDAPHIAAYYVGHNRAYYVQKAHDIGTLLMNAQVITKDYFTGYQTTGITAKWVEETETARSAAEQAKILIRQSYLKKQQKTA